LDPDDSELENEAQQPRLGRPPLTEVRQEQILDAVEECIVEYGLAATTLDRIARQAGVSRTAVNHFIGTKDEVIDAALARSVGRIRDQFRNLAVDAPGPERFERFLQLVFDPDRPGRRHVLVLMDEVISVAYRDEVARNHLTEMYADVEDVVGGYLADRYPDIPTEQMPLIAEALVLILREFDRMRTLGVCASPEDMPRRARIVVDALLAGFKVT
jgi:AcrR family transcriptional regulator